MPSVWVKTRTWVANAMKAYRAIGTFRNGRAEQNYSLDVVATDEDVPSIARGYFGADDWTLEVDPSTGWAAGATAAAAGRA